MNDHAFLPPKDGDDAPYAWLDEWLCEYVDGTMDPSLKANFEKYIEANPELKSHIEQLNETRDLLEQRCGSEPPSKEKRERVCRRVRSNVCQKVECDMLRSQESLGSLLRDHSRAALGIASSMAVALVVGIFTGALLFGSSDPFESSSPVAASAPSGTVSPPSASSSTSAMSAASTSAPSTSAPSAAAATPAVTTSATRSPVPLWAKGNARTGPAWSRAGRSAPTHTSQITRDPLPGQDRSALELASTSSATDEMVRPDGRTWAHVWFGDAAQMTLLPEAVPALVPWVPARIRTVALRPLQPVSETFLFGPEVNRTLRSPTQTPQPVLSSRRR